MRFDSKRATRVRKFIERFCTYSKGEWAGEPFRLLPWQWKELVRPLFGTLDDKGRRQYRTAYCEIPKKNGKTELIAAIALYMLTSDHEEGAEVYCAAADREQAGLIHQAAAAMVKNSPVLSGHLRCLDSRKRIVYYRKNSIMQTLSSESYTKHGLSPSCVIIDEIHAHPTDELWNVLTSGTNYARRQQVVIVITTAGIYDKNSIWWRLRSKAMQVRNGTIGDDTFLPVLFVADPEKDDPDSEATWEKTNPSLGRIFSLKTIRQDWKIAKENPVDYQNFLRFRLNIPIRQLARWMPMDAWDKCNTTVDPGGLEGRDCYGGLDLASRIDLAAFILVFPPCDGNGTFDILCRFYCPEEGIKKRSRVDRVPYDVWEKQGHLVATPGNVIDYAWIEKDILDSAGIYRLHQVGFDPWNAQGVATRIMEKLNAFNSPDGFQMVEIRQGVKSLNEPAKDLLARVLTGKIRHGGHPVLRWNADNLVMRNDANGNIAPDKSKATEKIDGMVALIMAWSRAMFRSKNEESVYESRGVVTL